MGAMNQLPTFRMPPPVYGHDTLPDPARREAEEPGDEEHRLQRRVQSALRAVRRRWWYPALGVAAALAFMPLFALIKPPQYQVSGLVQLGMYDLKMLNPWERRSTINSAFFLTHRELLSSNAVVEDAMRRMGVAPDSSVDLQEQREAFMEQVVITPLEDTFLVEVSAHGPDGEQAARRVNALLDAFIPFTNQYIGTLDVEEEEIAAKERLILAKYREVEQRQQEFFREVGSIRFEERRAGLIQSQDTIRLRLTELQLEGARAEAELDRRRRRLARFDDADVSLEQLTGLFGEGEGLPPERRQQLADLRARLQHLRATINPKKLAQVPEYELLEARVQAEAQVARDELHDKAKASLESQTEQLRTLAHYEQKVREELDETSKELARIDELETRYRTILREVEWYDRELEETRGQLRQMQSRIEGDATKMQASIVQRADVPLSPQPSLTTSKAAALLLFACGLGVLMALGRDVLDDTVAAADDVKHLGLPVLGRVPHLDPSQGDELTHLRESLPATEAFGLILTNLTAATGGLRGALLVTSGDPSVGKTLVSIKLAASLARAGERTLLIEADLRRPRVQEVLGLEHPSGLSDVLAGLRPFAEAIQPTEFVGLSLLPSGPSPLNATDLLLGGQFQKVIAAGLAEYDHVIVDAPPAPRLADTSLMARHVQGVLHVIRPGVSSRRNTLAAIRQVQVVGARNVGLVLSDVGEGEGASPFAPNPGRDFAALRRPPVATAPANAGQEPARGDGPA